MKGLHKWYGGRPVLRGVDLTVERGALVVIRGPNGSGKSTLLRCILGLTPYVGSIEVEGLDVSRHGREVRRVTGYAPQVPVFPRGLRTVEVAELHARLYGMHIDVGELLGRFGLDGAMWAKVEELSGGQRQRLALALAFAHGPHVALLDEPFNNLDAAGREMLLAFLEEVRGKVTLLVVSHELHGLSPDETYIIEDGKLLGS